TNILILLTGLLVTICIYVICFLLIGLLFLLYSLAFWNIAYNPNKPKGFPLWNPPNGLP
ncbi:hypothetical protein EZS27_033433, partial [termite gut metagenome]